MNDLFALNVSHVFVNKVFFIEQFFSQDFYFEISRGTNAALWLVTALHSDL